jgi:hypothetical protein
MSPAVHTVLDELLTAAVGPVLDRAGLEHVPHSDGDPLRAAEQAVADEAAVALLGPFRSSSVQEASEVLVGTELALLAPVATAAAVTRPDEPGEEPPRAPDPGATVLRMLARDTEVARRIAAELAATGRRALVVAGDHEYGAQLEAQLDLAGLPRTPDAAAADLVVVCGLAWADDDAAAVRALAPLPAVAFDGIQGADLGAGREVLLALPFAPVDGVAADEQFRGVHPARAAAGLVARAVAGGAAGRGAVLAALRRLGPFDAHGDPVGAPVWLWRADRDWTLSPERALSSGVF